MQFKDFGGPGKQDDGGSSNYLKIKDGESKRLILRGEIHEHYQKWTNGRPQECAPDEPGAGLRFKVNAIYEENGDLVCKIWSFGITIYEQLREINTEYPLEKTKIKVSRQGSTKDNTTYTVLPLLSAKDQLTPKVLEKIAGIQLNELERIQAPPLKNSAAGEDDFGF